MDLLVQRRVHDWMYYAGGNCDGCHRVLVKRSWKKLKYHKDECLYCGTEVTFVILHWKGYESRMENGASLVLQQ